MISVIILGTGNVASHLVKVFLQTKEIHLIQMYGRNNESLKKFKDQVEITSNLRDLKEADVYIIAISDDAISSFSSHLILKNKLVVHTSGGVSIDAIKNTVNKGVFYPLQTFTKDKPVNFKKVPICIETEQKSDFNLLNKLAKLISEIVYEIDSSQRKHMHLAAVFTNNFVNYMYKIGNDICNENNIPFKILQPLILETARKIENRNPADIQTGPAFRNDIKTIDRQINMLNGQKKEIYKLLTQSIQETYGKKL